MLVFTKQTGRKLPFDSWVPTATWRIITLWWSLSQPGVHPFTSFSKCFHIHSSTQTSVQQWTISLPLPAGISKLPSLKPGFWMKDISFILCMSRLLSVSVSVQSAVEIGWKVVKETPSRGGLLESVLSAPWGASGQINHVAESLSGLGLLKVWGLTQWDSSVDASTKSRIWRLLSQQEKLGRGWLLSFDSWLWNILQQWVDYSGLLLLHLSLQLRQCQGSLALPLEAKSCCERRWEQSILPLISNSGQMGSGGEVEAIGKMRVCFSGGTVIHSSPFALSWSPRVDCPLVSQSNEQGSPFFKY